MRTESRLTSNDKKVFLALLDNARITDSDISCRIKITPPGVRKIRKKLEEHYIQEYRTIVDYEKMGITVFAIIQIKTVNKNILNNEKIIGAFEINESNITHLLIAGFASLEDLDEYKRTIVKDAEIQNIHVVSKKGFLKNSPKNLIRSQIQRETRG
ncbi:TPA: winged helix-turn-helix transcriptional regulator [Candidatus Woesearchaeota archaeon]|nr:winged helix-turn-helix transcriptional regulator [Candidatus Woesearchaeota archaeon]HIH32116.1 winged helix-turn-helix transcriptional regulator [Candidatus Woesearchaeota archaeon]HIH54199.1 winged helix-turn-helix transcriptional regulator [Candidatus Woesearchaeota archaeon]HIJ01620.1 winged helix-turn-helix transcriptional regulator [Candidatus Woesearchaeota archaeon]HIJ14244.1 winged helix-turn-helix transcriptional regulator [Candidatus Woesearchaeota archaeon]